MISTIEEHPPRTHLCFIFYLINYLAPVLYLILISSLLIYLIFLLRSKDKTVFLKTFLPYLTGLLGLDLLTISQAFEYRTLCFLGFIPMLIAWLMRYKNNFVYKVIFAVGFILFMIEAFHAYTIFTANKLIDVYLTAVYMFYLIFMIITSIIFILKANKNTSKQ